MTTASCPLRLLALEAHRDFPGLAGDDRDRLVIYSVLPLGHCIVGVEDREGILPRSRVASDASGGQPMDRCQALRVGFYGISPFTIGPRRPSLPLPRCELLPDDGEHVEAFSQNLRATVDPELIGPEKDPRAGNRRSLG